MDTTGALMHYVLCDLNLVQGWWDTAASMFVEVVLPSGMFVQFGKIILTTSVGIMDHEEARRKKMGGKVSTTAHKVFCSPMCCQTCLAFKYV